MAILIDQHSANRGANAEIQVLRPADTQCQIHVSAYPCLWSIGHVKDYQCIPWFMGMEQQKSTLYH